MKKPWQKWFPTDWLSDASLTMCSAATRGVWMDALCAMMQADTCSLYGTIDQLARVARTTNEVLEAALNELRDTNAASVEIDSNGSVTLLSRRLEREGMSRETNRLRQQRFRDNAGVTPPVTPLSRECHTPLSASASAYVSVSSEEEVQEKEGEKRSAAPTQNVAMLAKLHQQPELRGLTLEQFITAHKCHPVALTDQRIETIKTDASLIGHIQSPGSWFRKQLSKIEQPPAKGGYRPKGKPPAKLKNYLTLADIEAGRGL